MNRAIFLDRDGVINEERKDYVKNPGEFKILEGVDKAIKLIRNNGYLVIIITNQSAVNRGLISENMLNIIHEQFQKYLKKSNTMVDGFYFCPHKPDEDCLCRKPKPEMIFSAAKYHNIDLKNSYFIGDSTKDFDAAKNAGCNGILLQEDQTLLDCILQLFKNLGYEK